MSPSKTNELALEVTIEKALTRGIKLFSTGIPEMYALTAERGLMQTLFTDEKIFKVTLWRPSAKVTDHDTDHDTGQVTAHDTVQVTVQVTGQVTGQVHFHNNLSEPERVVLILTGEMMREELMSTLDLKHRDNFMEKYLNPALAKGWIERTIPNKPTRSKQKYRLTTQGWEYKKELENERK